MNLIELLDSCEALLRSVHEDFWANKIIGIKQKVDNNVDIYILEEIESWYGGMGSFNDLIISNYNGHLIEEKYEKELNDELNKVRNQIYQEVIKLIAKYK